MVDKMDVKTLSHLLDIESLYALPRDVSPREYFRGEKNGQKIIVMVYPQVNADNLTELMDFISIGKWLNQKGINTPQCIELHKENCLAIFEDLGDMSFGDALRKGVPSDELYALATEVLCTLRDVLPPSLPPYKESRIHANRRQLIDYYVPLIHGKKAPESTVQEFLAMWDGIEQALPPCPQGFVHGDYHLENLIYQPEENGLKQCGLIDYQDALHGPIPYDLLNILEDARMSVPEDIKAAMIKHYCAQMSSMERDVFMVWYRVLAAQFHGRVLGLFVKLAAEQGRDSYLGHIPRLQEYMMNSLEYSVLEPLKVWFEKEGVDFNSIKDLDGENIRKRFKSLNYR